MRSLFQSRPRPARDQRRLGFEAGTVALPRREAAREFDKAFRRFFEKDGAKVSVEKDQPEGSAALAATWLATPIGPMVAAASTRGLCLLEFGEEERLAMQVAGLRRRFRTAVRPGESPYLDQLRGELPSYFGADLRRFTVPLDARGTPFEERVWAELLRIPYGETRSYEQLAVTLGTPSGQRAVGRANGMNPVVIVIPCHRVVNKSGRLGGYGGGLWRKELLLRLEQEGIPLAR
jgi:O-6-methylguanine DNA methyltransferase